MSEWIEWHGGEKPSVNVCAIKMRTGEVHEVDGIGCRWSHTGLGGDIVAFKVRDKRHDLHESVIHHSVDHGLERAHALSTQVGGTHYANKPIQPVVYAMANKLGPCEFSAVKYVTRHKEKGGRQDIEKAIHFLQILLEQEYPEVGEKRVAEWDGRIVSAVNHPEAGGEIK